MKTKASLKPHSKYLESFLHNCVLPLFKSFTTSPLPPERVFSRVGSWMILCYSSPCKMLSTKDTIPFRRVKLMLGKLQFFFKTTMQEDTYFFKSPGCCGLEFGEFLCARRVPERLPVIPNLKISPYSSMWSLIPSRVNLRNGSSQTGNGTSLLPLNLRSPIVQCKCNPLFHPW